MSRAPRTLFTVFLALVLGASWTASAGARGLQEQRLFWARFTVDAEVTELVLHGAGREAWTTTWRPPAGELGAAERWLPIALGSEFELQMGAPVRADDGPGEARFLEWAPALPEFARGVPLEVWSRALPQDAAVARGWSPASGLGLTAVALAFLALAGLRRASFTPSGQPPTVHGRRAALAALVLGGGAALLAALRLDWTVAARPWGVYELSGPEGGLIPPGLEQEPRGLKLTFDRDSLEWAAPIEGEGPAPVVLRTDPPGAALRLTSTGDSAWRIDGEGAGLALAETDGLRPLFEPPLGPHPFSEELWGAFSGDLQAMQMMWTPDLMGTGAADGPRWAFWGRNFTYLQPFGESFLPPGWLVGGAPRGRQVLLICDSRRRIALRWIGLDG